METIDCESCVLNHLIFYFDVGYIRMNVTFLADVLADVLADNREISFRFTYLELSKTYGS